MGAPNTSPLPERAEVGLKIDRGGTVENLRRTVPHTASQNVGRGGSLVLARHRKSILQEEYQSGKAPHGLGEGCHPLDLSHKLDRREITAIDMSIVYHTLPE